MMKNIYKIKILILASLVFSSCAVDDDDPVIADQITVIEASMATPSLVRIGAADTSYDFQVTFSGVLPNSAQISYTIDGVPFEAYTDVGSSTVTVTVDVSNVTLSTFSLTDAIMLYASAQNINVKVSETANITTTVVKGNDDLAELTWSGGNGTYLGLFPDSAPEAPFFFPGTIIGVVGPDNPVVAVFGTLTDGDYSFAILPQVAFSEPVAYTLTLINGNSLYRFTGTLNEAGPLTGDGFFTPFVFNTVAEFVTFTNTGGTFSNVTSHL